MKVELITITHNAELLIEEAGRTAYLSFDKKKKGSEKAFIRKLIKSGHLSVLEHAWASFRIEGGSRSFTHQLVRHRLCSFTQQSQRYVNEQSFNYIEPDDIKSNVEAHNLYIDFLNKAKDVYTKLQQLGIENEDARFVLPNAVASEIVITANFREWRHIVEIRGSSHAQWEIRRITIEILRILKQHAPTVFGDFIIDDEQEVVNRVDN